jgi:hypothetical protein
MKLIGSKLDPVADLFFSRKATVKGHGEGVLHRVTSDQRCSLMNRRALPACQAETALED